MDQPGAALALQARYVGRARELMPLHLKTLGLTIVTLGIYRFWARTRLRQHIWRRIVLEGDGLEYTGTGAELFFGFLKALCVLLPLAIAYFAVQVANEIDPSLWLGALQAALYVAFIYLYMVGSYAGLRYRMNRTRWRGIRFRQDGSPWRYGAIALGGYLLGTLTLGFYLPYLHVKLARFEAEHRTFGSQRFSFDGKGSELMPAFFLAFFMVLVVMLLFAFLVFMVIQAVAHFVPGHVKANAELGAAIGLGVVFLVLFLFYGGIYAVFAHYNAARYTYVIEHTRWGDLAFAAAKPITPISLIRLVLGNVVTMVFTLTLLYPVIVRRTMRFWCERIAASGMVDFARITQTEAVTGTGEGLAGYFNVDAMGG